MEYLKLALKARGITQRELGERIGCSESAISQYVNDRRSPDYETLLKMAEELDTSVEFLLRGSEHAPIINSNVIDLSELSEDQRTLIKAILRLNPQQLSAFRSLAETLIAGQ